MRFGITGVAGFVAPRHLEAIRAIGGTVVAALDPHDSVGILDRYNRQCRFFTEPERFDRHLDKLRRAGEPIDWLAVCSPNHLHDAHIRMGIRSGCNVLCEKPLVLRPWNLQGLKTLAAEYDRKIKTVLQLRSHPTVKALKERLPAEGRRKVSIIYRTPRGQWYHHSWKGDPARSGGVVMNIGVHLFDLLIYLFGHPTGSPVVAKRGDHTSVGVVELARADVDWHLSVDADAPERCLWVDGEEIDISARLFDDAHTRVYQETIVDGKGWGPDDTRASIALCSAIATM